MSAELEQALGLIADRDPAWNLIWMNSTPTERVVTLGSFALFLWQSLEDAELEPDTWVTAQPGQVSPLRPGHPHAAWTIRHREYDQRELSGMSVRTVRPWAVCLLPCGIIAHCKGTPPDVQLSTKINPLDNTPLGCASDLLSGELLMPSSPISDDERVATLTEWLADFARMYEIV